MKNGLPTSTVVIIGIVIFLVSAIVTTMITGTSIEQIFDYIKGMDSKDWLIINLLIMFVFLPINYE